MDELITYDIDRFPLDDTYLNRACIFYDKVLVHDPRKLIELDKKDVEEGWSTETFIDILSEKYWNYQNSPWYKKGILQVIDPPDFKLTDDEKTIIDYETYNDIHDNQFIINNMISNYHWFCEKEKIDPNKMISEMNWENRIYNNIVKTTPIEKISSFNNDPVKLAIRKIWPKDISRYISSSCLYLKKLEKIYDSNIVMSTQFSDYYSQIKYKMNKYSNYSPKYNIDILPTINLPYIDNIPAQIIIKNRNNEKALSNFRNHMRTIFHKYSENIDDDTQIRDYIETEVKENIEDISNYMNQLKEYYENEYKPIIRNLSIFGLISCIPPLNLLGIGLIIPTILKSYDIINKIKTEYESIQENPYYFVWKINYDNQSIDTQPKLKNIIYNKILSISEPTINEDEIFSNDKFIFRYK